MGQYSLLAVLAAFLLSGIVVYNASQSADRADEKVWEHQYHVLARDAASTGMASTARLLAANINSPWNETLTSALEQDEVSYEGGTYDVTATVHATECPLLNASNLTQALDGFIQDGDIIFVTAEGALQGRVMNDDKQSHQIQACYVKADYGLFAPPAFNYGFIADEDVTFNGGPTIQALIEGEGHIHSNGYMTLKKNVVIDGHATYTEGGSIHQQTQVASFTQGPAVPLELFDAEAFQDYYDIPSTCTSNPNRCLYSENGFSSSGDVTIQPETCSSEHCAEEPFIWFIDGDFDVSGGAHITIPQYTVIVVDGDIDISGNASVTVSGTEPPTCTDCPDLVQAWIQAQLLDGVHSPLAWYGTGTGRINGTSGLVGNFYINGDFTLNGGGNSMNSVGSIASAGGTITANGGGNNTGKGNFWFLEVAEQNVIPGIALPGKQIVRIALAEWTDPLLPD